MIKRLPRTKKLGYELPGKKAQVVLFHGYTGSPYDLRPIADYLSTHDVHVSVPLMKGHGTKPSDLHTVTADDWLQDAEEIFSKLDKKRPVIVGGLSMGALIALLLAAEHDNICGLILFSPSLKLTTMAELTIAAGQIGVLDRKYGIKKLTGGSDIADPIAKARTPAYLEMPVSGLIELEKLRIKALENIGKISCPVFLAFGKHDGAIDTSASHRAMIDACSAPLTSKFYPKSKHVITLDYDRDHISVDVARFITQQCGIKL